MAFRLDMIGKKVMAVLLDIYGNEARILIDAKDFGKPKKAVPAKAKKKPTKKKNTPQKKTTTKKATGKKKTAKKGVRK